MQLCFRHWRFLNCQYTFDTTPNQFSLRRRRRWRWSISFGYLRPLTHSSTPSHFSSLSPWVRLSDCCGWRARLHTHTVERTNNSQPPSKLQFWKVSGSWGRQLKWHEHREPNLWHFGSGVRHIAEGTSPWGHRCQNVVVGTRVPPPEVALRRLLLPPPTCWNSRERRVKHIFWSVLQGFSFSRQQ